MHRNPVWFLFLSLILIGLCLYTGHTMIKIWHTIRLDQQTKAQEIEWSIISSSDEAYIPFAHYSFIVEDKRYEGQMRWPEIYLNRWAAEEAITRLKQAPPPVWFNSSSPSVSSLYKSFPLKESIYTFLLWILACYFIGLGYYVKQR